MSGNERQPHFLHFYPGDLESQIEKFLEPAPRPAVDLPARLSAAVVPHAGWRFSGALAARALLTLAARSRPEGIVVFGAVHRAALERSAVYARGAWATPLGRVEMAEALGQEVLRSLGDLCEENPGAHETEHSIEVEMPLILKLFPGVPVLPIMVPPHACPAELGGRLAHLVGQRHVVAVGSTDLTHYGPRYGLTPRGQGTLARSWLCANDDRMLRLATGLTVERIPDEAARRRNACGPGALAAALAFARERGARKAVLLEHTNSHDVATPTEELVHAVGYAGLVA